MDRTFALWFGVPTFVVTVSFVAMAYFAPTLFSDSMYLVMAGSVFALVSIVGCIHAILSLRTGRATLMTVLHPVPWLPVLAILAFAGDAWGIRSALWQYATTSTLESEGIWFKRADDGSFRPRVSVDGNILQVVVDPEISHILLSRADAMRIGIDLSAVTFDVSVNGPDGPQPAATISLKKVQLLSVSMTDVPAFVPEHDLAVSVLGRAFLDRTRDWGVKGDTLMILPWR